MFAGSRFASGLLTLAVVGGMGVGSASASSVTQTFDGPVATGNSQAPGVWYTDRYAPQIFESASFDGDNRLHVGLRRAGWQANRAQNGDFYNYQGRKFDILDPTHTIVSADLYVDEDWADGARAGLWVTASNGNLSYPIIEYATDETDSGTTNSFRWWQSDVGWTNIAEPVTGNQWYNLTISLTSTQVLFSIVDLSTNNTLFSGWADNLGADSFDNLILQGHNQGRAGEYDIYWDNVTTAAVPTPAAAGIGLVLISALGLMRRRESVD